MSEIRYGKFENYAFEVDGKIIEKDDLIDLEGAKIYKIFPYTTTIQGHDYLGVVYLHTSKHPVSSDQYADDPAYFINGRQVSPYDIRSSKPRFFNKIEKSIGDTVIGGKRYKGVIQVDTDEDFFSKRITLSEFLKKHIDLPLEQVVVDWRGVGNYGESDTGTVIYGHYSIYHFDPISLSIGEIDRIRLADEEHYVVHLLDSRYKKGYNEYRQGVLKKDKWYTPGKVQMVFEEPLAIDTACPCYIEDFNTNDPNIFVSTEIDSEPYPNEKVYLKKLGATMGIYAVKPLMPVVSDSINVQFVVTKAGMLGGLKSVSADRSNHESILNAIKRHSCLWSSPIQNGRPMMSWRRMTIFYSKDNKGNILSLDTIKYRNDKW
ncbi:hypothetical protein [Parapedobacter sp.]